jgi:hypothetical protein
MNPFIEALLIAFVSCQEPPIFEDWSERAGIKGIEGARVAFADLDGDGRPDAVIEATRVLLNRDGKWIRRAADAEFLVSPGGRRPQAVQFGDVNNDGRLDLALCFMTDLKNPDFKDDGRRNEIWIGDGKGGFMPVKDSGIGAQGELSITACFLDYDRDGVLDLFVGNWYERPGKAPECFPSRLFRGRGHGSFEDVTEKAGLMGAADASLRDGRRPVFGVAHTDWNNDGLQDLLVLAYGRQWNVLWRNNGNGTFTDVAAGTTFDGDADRSGKYSDEVKKIFRERKQDLEDEREWRSNGNTFDCAVADFDNDGDMDCFLAEIAHWWAGPSSDRSMLLVNQGAAGGFVFRRDPDRITRVHPGPRWNEGDLHAGWLDVDNDGWLDLLIASSDYPDLQILKLYHQEAGGAFVEWTDRLGFRWMNASQISLGDFDRDGATDILIGTNNMRLNAGQIASRPLSAGLFRNALAGRTGNGFFNVRLKGQAVGARVTLIAGGLRQTREVFGGLGHAGHRDDTDCRFGLGRAARVDRLEVRWPDAAATVQVFEKVEKNRFYTLEKGGKLQEVK